MAGGIYVLICFVFGVATGMVGRGRGSSFFIWFLVGAVLPIIGFVAALLYRSEEDEPERTCPTCNKRLKLYVQVCPRCGTDLYLPEPGPGDRVGET